MVLLLDRDDVASLVDGPDLMRRVIDVIEGSFRDVAAWSAPRDPTVFPTDLSVPKLYTIMGAAPSVDAIGGCLHLRGGEAGMGKHSSYKLAFDLMTGDLLCLMEDGPVHRYMHGADVGVATKWLARDDADTLAVVTAGPVGSDGPPSPAIAAATARGAIVTMATVEAITAVRPVREVRIASTSTAHAGELVERVRTELGVAAEAAETAEAAVRGAAIVSISTNNFYLTGGTAGVDASWLAPGTHVNVVIRGEVDAEFAKQCTLIPASIADLYAIEPPWEPFVGLAERGEVHMPAGLDEVVSDSHPGRTSPEETTLFTGASIGAQHASLAAWVYGLALERGIGTRWEQRG